MSAGEGGMHTMCSKAAATPGVLLSNYSLAVQSIKSHTLGQRDGKEHVSSPHGVRRSAKTDFKDAGNILGWMGDACAVASHCMI